MTFRPPINLPSRPRRTPPRAAAQPLGSRPNGARSTSRSASTPAALRHRRSGSPPAAPDLVRSRAWQRGLAARADDPSPDALAPNEQRIVRLLCEGFDRQEIAARIRRSRSTLDRTICRIYAATGFSSAYQVVAWAHRTGAHVRGRLPDVASHDDRDRRFVRDERDNREAHDVGAAPHGEESS